jgi:hypothetical protein
MPRDRRSLAVELTLLALGAALLAALMQWPLPLHLGSDIAKDLGDPLSQSWQVAWDGHALLRQPLHFFDANQFFPNHDTLAYSDALIGYAPVGAIGSGPHAAIARYDLLFLFAYALALAGAYVLARTLGATKAAAIVAGAAYAFSPWRLEQSGHLHVISSGGIPLALALLVRGWRRERPWVAAAGWLVATWQLSLGWTLGLQLGYLLGAIGLVLGALRWSARRRGERLAPAPRRLLGANVAGALLFALVGVLLGRVYLHVAAQFPQARRGPQTVAVYSGSPVEFLAAGRDSFVWSGITAPVRHSLRAVAEQSLFPGLTIAALGVLGALRGPWPRGLRRALVAATLITAVLALGFADAGHRWLFPYGWLYAMPGWSAIRTPGRLMTLTTLALALLAAAGAQRLELRRRWAPYALALLVLVEGSALSLHGGALHGPPHPAVPKPPAGLAAATPPLLELPMGMDDNRRYLLWSTAGFPPMANGRSSLNPTTFTALGWQVARFPDASSVRRLRALGIRTVVLHLAHVGGTPWADWRARPWRALGISRELRDGVVLYRLPVGRS